MTLSISKKAHYIILSVVLPNVIMLSGVLLNVVLLNVVAPKKRKKKK